MWIRNVILELAVTLLIVVATIPEPAWARWIVMAYTILMLALKVIALLGRNVMKSVRPTNPDVPSWFWHVNYGVNVALLAVDAWWLVALGWFGIWILSFVFEQRMHPTPRS